MKKILTLLILFISLSSYGQEAYDGYGINNDAIKKWSKEFGRPITRVAVRGDTLVMRTLWKMGGGNFWSTTDEFYLYYDNEFHRYYPDMYFSPRKMAYIVNNKEVPYDDGYASIMKVQKIDKSGGFYRDF